MNEIISLKSCCEEGKNIIVNDLKKKIKNNGIEYIMHNPLIRNPFKNWHLTPVEDYLRDHNNDGVIHALSFSLDSRPSNINFLIDLSDIDKLIKIINSCIAHLYDQAGQIPSLSSIIFDLHAAMDKSMSWFESFYSLKTIDEIIEHNDNMYNLLMTLSCEDDTNFTIFNSLSIRGSKSNNRRFVKVFHNQDMKSLVYLTYLLYKFRIDYEIKNDYNENIVPTV